MMLRTLTALTTLVIGIALVSAGQLGAAPAQTAAASQVGRDGEQATPHGRAAGEALVPESHHARLSLETVEHLTRHHFVRRPIDDRLSSQVFDKYIEALDPQRLYFLAADLKDFETYRLSLDDALERLHRRRVLRSRPGRRPLARQRRGVRRPVAQATEGHRAGDAHE